MSRVREINSRGLAKGWHAHQLMARAASQGETMAASFMREVENLTAFNVPAECTRVTSTKVYYRFSDGSTISFPNQGGRA